MSKVRISAIGDVGIEVEVMLGATSRGKNLVNAGDSIDLTVGGNQRLVTKESDKAAPRAKAEIPIGVDVSGEPAPDPAADEPGVLAKLGTALFSDVEANAELPVQGDLFDGFDKSDR